MASEQKGSEKDITSRGWMVTLPESEYSKEEVQEKLSNYIYVGQLEKGSGETEYRHWQIYIENESQIRFSTLRSKFPKGHFEKRVSTKEACFSYVTKEDTSLGVQISNGEMNLRVKKPGRAEQFDRYRTLILTGTKTVAQLVLEDSGALAHHKSLQILEYEYRKKLYKGRIRDIEVHYIFGKTGVGKTRLVYDLYQNRYEDLYVVSDYSNPFDLYDNEDCLVLDEFAGQLEVEAMLKILDRYPTELRARYQNRQANFTKVYILSNVELDDCYSASRLRNSRQWDALLRRITTYQEMVESGTLIDRELPQLRSSS